MKALLWEGDGFVLLYKRLENGSFKWPRDETEVKPITWQQFRWLMEGLQVEQKQFIQPAKKGRFLLWIKGCKPLILFAFSHFLWYNYLIKKQRNYTGYERKRGIYSAP